MKHRTTKITHSNNKTKRNINWQTYGQIGASRTINRGGVQLGASARGEQEGEYNMKSKQIQLLIHFIKGEGWGHPWLCIGFEACLGKWEETGRGRERARGRDIKATLSCVPRCCLEQNRLRTLRTEAVCSSLDSIAAFTSSPFLLRVDESGLKAAGTLDRAQTPAAVLLWVILPSPYQ